MINDILNLTHGKWKNTAQFSEEFVLREHDLTEKQLVCSSSTHSVGQDEITHAANSLSCFQHVGVIVSRRNMFLSFSGKKPEIHHIATIVNNFKRKCGIKQQ